MTITVRSVKQQPDVTAEAAAVDYSVSTSEVSPESLWFLPKMWNTLYCQAEVFTHAAVYMEQNSVRGAVHWAGNQVPARIGKANLIF